MTPKSNEIVIEIKYKNGYYYIYNKNVGCEYSFADTFERLVEHLANDFRLIGFDGRVKTKIIKSVSKRKSK